MIFQMKASVAAILLLASSPIIWGPGRNNIVSDKPVGQAQTDPGLVGTVNLGSADGTGGATNPSGAVSADYATVIGGDGNFARAPYSMAGGNRSDARGPYAFAYGYRCFADEYGSFCGGAANVALSRGSVVFGEGSWARGEYSFAAGISCVTGVPNRHDIARGAIAMGYNAYAGRDAAVAHGWQTEALAKGSFASGITSRASGEGSTALGRSEAAGDYSTSIGYGRATRWGEFAVGGHSAGEGQLHRVSMHGPGGSELRLQGDEPMLRLVDGAYSLRLRLLARPTTGGVAAMERHIVASVDRGILTLARTDDSGAVGSIAWVTRAEGNMLHVECSTGATRCVADVEWTQL